MLLPLLHAVMFAGFVWASSAQGAEWPVLQTTINDFASIIPPASYDDLEGRLQRFKTRTGHTVAVVTVPSLDQDIETLARAAFHRLPLNDREKGKSVLLLVARQEHLVAIEAGADIRALFPKGETTRKLQNQLDLYINGLRPDLGIYGGLHFIFGVITGEFRAAATTEEEALQNASLSGAGAGAIFALVLAPSLAFFVSMLLGIYSTHAGFQRETRLFLGIVFGGGTAQLVAMLMAMVSPYNDGLWYFILASGMILGAFACLTEYWMHGDWSGIPRVKDKVKRKPEDKMGI